MTSFALSLAGVAAAIGAAELALRLSGRTPWGELSLSRGEETLHAPDERLGWRNRPGERVWRSPAPGVDPIHMTFWKGGRRATRPDPDARPRRVLVLGDSFTQGFAVSDPFTWPWRVQAEFPEHAFDNFGTAGYGTYQSLLVLEAELSRKQPPIAAVIYGFADFHEARNVAEPSWLRSLSAAADAAIVRVPHATLGAAGELQRHPPAAHPDWPLKRQLALASLLQDGFAELEGGGRAEQATEVTEALLLGMARLCRRARVPLLVAVLAQLRPDSARYYLGFLRRHHVAAVDCSHARAWHPERQVPLYGHPNAQVHAEWATCIAEALRAHAGWPASAPGSD